MDQSQSKPPAFKTQSSFPDSKKIEQAMQDERDNKIAEAEAEEKRLEDEERAKDEKAHPENAELRKEREEQELMERGVWGAVKNKRMLPEELLADFDDLMSAIRDKKFLLTGYATIQREIWNLPVTLKTPSQREYAVIQALSEGTPNTITGMKTYHLAEQSRWMVVFMVQKWGEETFPIPEAPRIFDAQRLSADKETTLKEFMANGAVRTKLDFFESMPLPVYERLSQLCLDLVAVLFIALRHDSKNP